MEQKKRFPDLEIYQFWLYDWNSSIKYALFVKYNIMHINQEVNVAYLS